MAKAIVRLSAGIVIIALSVSVIVIVVPDNNADHNRSVVASAEASNKAAFAKGYSPTPAASTAALESAVTNKQAEAFSPLAAPQPFNLADFQADPQAYANQIVPGRIYQVAKAGPGVTQLIPSGPQNFELPRGQVAKLSVKAAPHAPVTFHSFDLGAFENDFPTMTVLANASGLAQATFRATAGTVADCAIKAASPLHVGQVLFHVSILEPGTGHP